MANVQIMLDADKHLKVGTNGKKNIITWHLFPTLFLWLSRFYKNKNSINCLTCMMIWVLYYLGLVVWITKSSWHKMSLIIASESYMAFLEVRNGNRGQVRSQSDAIVDGTHALQLSCTTVGASRRRRRAGGRIHSPPAASRVNYRAIRSVRPLGPGPTEEHTQNKPKRSDFFGNVQKLRLWKNLNFI